MKKFKLVQECGYDNVVGTYFFKGIPSYNDLVNARIPYLTNRDISKLSDEITKSKLGTWISLPMEDIIEYNAGDDYYLEEGCYFKLAIVKTTNKE